MTKILTGGVGKVEVTRAIDALGLDALDVTASSDIDAAMKLRAGQADDPGEQPSARCRGEQRPQGQPGPGQAHGLSVDRVVQPAHAISFSIMLR